MESCGNGAVGTYVVQEGFLFKGNRFCVPKCSNRELLVREAQRGGIVGHFGTNKTLAILQEHFYWPKMQGVVQGVLARCASCQKAKSMFHNGLYNPLLVPEFPWEDVSVDFIVRCLELKGARISS